MKQEIHRYFKSMSYVPGSGQWRLDRRNRIRKILPFKAGDSPREEEIKEVLGCLHCLHSYSLNKSKILSENDSRSIATAWNKLINAPFINSQLLEEVIGEIKHFGMSSACELIAWYYPKKYPMINLNSEGGMRFFGFSI